MLQNSACNKHFFNFTTCVNRHRKWYDARFEALARAVPEDQVPSRDVATFHERKPDTVSEFKKVSK
jgi:hypothetical protein